MAIHSNGNTFIDFHGYRVSFEYMAIHLPFVIPERDDIWTFNVKIDAIRMLCMTMTRTDMKTFIQWILSCIENQAVEDASLLRISRLMDAILFQIKIIERFRATYKYNIN